MISVHCIGVSFAHNDALPLLTDLNLHLVPGWTGIVGANGAGKTTFLRLLARELTPDRGQIRVHPPGLRIALCAQTVNDSSTAIEAVARSDEASAHRLREELRLQPADLARWETLSPGERKRWQIAAALLAEPHLLLLDEPTNHLDGDARARLLRGLATFRGIGLVVSHDRDLLVELTAYTLRFHQRSVRLWRGSYSHARAAWEAEARECQDAYARVKATARTLERRLADKRRSRAAAEAKAHTRVRMRNLRDHDARSMMAKGKARAGEARLARDVGVIRHKLERTAAEVAGYRFEKTPGRSVFVDYVRAPMSCLLRLDAAVLRAGERELLADVHLTIERETRVRLAGPNGCGKSTLLAALMAQARLPAAKLLYLPQELRAEEEIALLESVRALAPSERGRVLSLVAALGVEPEQLLASARPSPGEARKLMIAYGLGRYVWAIVLDEPTNHLDLPAIERLEDALAGYPGALVLVTHDDHFARRCTSTVWNVRDRRVTVDSG